MSALECVHCGGRGWTRNAEQWPEMCDRCTGRGEFSFYALGKRLGVDPRTVRRIGELRSRPETCARVVGELAELAR